MKAEDFAVLGINPFTVLGRDTILCNAEFNNLYRKHGQLRIKKKK